MPAAEDEMTMDVGNGPFAIKIKAKASGTRREDGLTSAQVEAQLAQQKESNDGA